MRNTTYLALTLGRPTRDSISDELGFSVPSRFAEFVAQVYDHCDGNSKLCESVFDNILGLCWLEGREARYASTPPELFPIGSIGSDGVHYGFLLHAPELELDDLPYATICPMDLDGVRIVGSNTEKGIASEMASVLSWDRIDEKRREVVQAVARYCSIVPVVEKSPMPMIPEGWRHLPSRDGVGTLAPASWFSSEPLFEISLWTMPEEYVWAADVFIKQNQFGTALHYLREGLWRYWLEKNVEIGERTCDLYRKMNRPQLAEVLEWTMANRWAELR